MTKYDRLKPVAGGQLGAFTGKQANDIGITSRELRSRVHSGTLDKAGVRTYRDPLTLPTPLAELTALVLDVQEPCWVSGPSAAAIHNFDGFRLSRPYHLVVSRGRSVRRTNATIHTSNALPLIDCERLRGLPVLSPTRALLDVAGMVSLEVLTAALDGAVRDGLTTEDAVIRRLVALRTHGRRGVLNMIAAIEGTEAIKGGHSWLEREYLKLAAAARLPRPAMQRVMGRAGSRLVRVDCHYPGTNVIVELLGYRWHRSKEQMQRDTDRMNALILSGYLPLQFTTVHLVERPAFVTATVAGALGLHVSARTDSRFSR